MCFESTFIADYRICDSLIRSMDSDKIKFTAQLCGGF